MTGRTHRDDGEYWARVGSWLGPAAATCLVVGTALFLRARLADAPTFRATDAGFERDLAGYYASWFAHERQVLGSTVAREVLYLVAFVSLTILVAGVGRRSGRGRAEQAVLVGLFGAGSLVHVMADFVYLGNASVWRQRGWAAEPVSNMIAAGRTAEAVSSVSDALEVLGYLLLVPALALLVTVLPAARPGRRVLVTVTVFEAVGLLALTVGIAAEVDLATQVGGALAGLLAGPPFALLLGRLLRADAGSVAAPAG